MKIYLILLIIFSFTSCQSREMVLSTQTENNNIQAVIDSLRMLSKVNGVQFCILDSAGTKRCWTSGHKDRKNKGDLITNESTVRIGSTTKLFTNYIIMRLVQDSIISLDDKLSNWYPDFPRANEITVRNLLMHKSGATEILRFPIFLMECTFNPQKKYTINKLIEFLTEKGSKRAQNPNEKYEYSNTNYILLGGIAEKIYKKEFEQLIDSLANDLKLFNTSYIKPKYPNKLISGYDKDFIPFPRGYKNKPNNTSWTSLAASSGGIISNANDLCNFFNFYINGDGLNSATKSMIFSFEPCEHENLPEVIGIGLGIFQIKIDSVEYWGHEGQMIGSESLVLYCPSNKMVLCVTGNRSAFKNKYRMISQVNNILLQKTK